MALKSLTDRQKFKTVLERNTYFFNYEEFEDKWEANISSIANLLLLLKSELEDEKNIEKKKQIVADFVYSKQDGFSAVLSLNSISEEFMLRLITFIRRVNDEELNKLVKKESFPATPIDREWNKKYLFKLVRTNRVFAEGLVNLLFEGITVPILREVLPLFELKKLDFKKLDFTTESLIDSLVRQSKKGSYKACRDNDPSGLLKRFLDINNIKYKSNVILPNVGRKVDFAIPDEENVKIIIESSYEITTSSAMGDKAKTEKQVATDIKIHYPRTAFIGFVDGIGWYVRRSDLERLVSAFDDVFTFKQSELERFLKYVLRIL